MEELNEIYKNCYKYVKSYAPSLCLNEDVAEEITQETFYKAILNYDKFKNNCHIETWLCSIAKNEFLLIKRKEKRKKKDYEIYLPPDNFISKSDDKETAKRIFEICQELDSPKKEVFYMRALGDASFDFIGKFFGKSEAWARVTYFRTKQKIIEKLGDSDE